jgi:hypothetical protein
MRYERFEDLPVWNDAIELAVQVYALTSRPEFKGHWSLKDQLERAAVSVSNNIAEGFERGTNNELLAFLTFHAVQPAKPDPCSACWSAFLFSDRLAKKSSCSNQRPKVAQDN